jgi:hypothetical protein
MGGGFLQLAANGEEDIYLTGNPQVTFFVSVYKRYTNFSIENIRQYFIGEVNFGKKVYCILDKIGDLVNDIFIHVKLPSLIEFNQKINDLYKKNNPNSTNVDITYHWINYIGNALIKYVEIEIGGVVIDKHYGIWLQIWSELTLPDEKKQGYYDMIGFDSYNKTDFYFKNQSEYNLYIPLNFWFCRDRGLALPIIAIQNQEVRINVEFRKVTDLIIRQNCTLNKINGCGKSDYNVLSYNNLELKEAELYVDFIYLEDDERRYFAQSKHEYLIEQVQLNTETLYSRGKKNLNINNKNILLETCNITNSQTPSTTIYDTSGCAPIVQDHKVEINFKHPVKELIWVFTSQNMTEVNEDNGYQGNEWFNFGINTYPNCNPNSNEELYAFTDNNYLTSNLNNYIEFDASDNCIDDDLITGKSINSDYGIDPNNISPLNDAILYIEGRERFQKREHQYFKLIQPYQRHTNIPLDWIYVYSFAFEPEKITPTGTCNFSKIDNSHFVFNISKYLINPQINIFATNYNILVIQNGYCGVMYK